SEDVEKVMDHFGKFESVVSVLGRGETKMSVQLANALQVDLRIVPKESYGAALVYFTGSKAHNIVLRGMAKDRGLRINEYGVYKVGATAKGVSAAAKSVGATAKSAGKVAKSKSGAKAEKKKVKSAADESAKQEDEGVYIAGRTEKDVYATLDLP